MTQENLRSGYRHFIQEPITLISWQWKFMHCITSDVAMNVISAIQKLMTRVQYIYIMNSNGAQMYKAFKDTFKDALTESNC